MDLLALLIPRREVIVPIDHTELEAMEFGTNLADYISADWNMHKAYKTLVKGLEAAIWGSPTLDQPISMSGLSEQLSNDDSLDTVPYSTRVFKGIPAVEGGLASTYVHPDFPHFEHQPCGWEHYQEPVQGPDAVQRILTEATDKSLIKDLKKAKYTSDSFDYCLLKSQDIANELGFRGLL